MLKMCETFGRSSCSMISDCVPGDVEEDIDEKQAEDLTMWSQPDSNKSDEDFFLPRPIPTPLLALPSILLDARTDKQIESLEDKLKESLLERRKDTNAQNLLDLVGKIFSREVQQAKMFRLGLGRHSSSCTAAYDSQFDQALFLDYIPILRNVAVHERAAESDPELEAAGQASRGRTTRRSARRGRIHFFEKLSDSFSGDENELTASSVGQKLIDTMLIYYGAASSS
jgi:hypothetical protein